MLDVLPRINQLVIFYNNVNNIFRTMDSIDPEILFDLKCICNFMGIAINVCVAATIIRRRRARCKPRNIFLLGILFSCLLFFAPDLIEVIRHQGFNSVGSVCQLQFAMAGVPHVLLLLSVLLALTDRHLAINHPVWYQEKMTARLACSIIVIGAIVIVFFLEIDYVVRLGTLRCDKWLVHANVTSTILILLFVSCAVLNSIVYLQIKVPQFETMSPSGSFDAGSMGWIDELAPVEMEFRNEREESHGPYDVNTKILSSVEMEATRTLTIAVTYLLSYQTVVIVSAFLACRFVFGELECVNFKWMGPCVKELTLIPAFYGPLIFLMKNQEIVTDEIGPV